MTSSAGIPILIGFIQYIFGEQGKFAIPLTAAAYRDFAVQGLALQVIPVLHSDSLVVILLTSLLA